MGKQGEHGIAWTDQTWNPVRGCTRVSEGCRNCYAESVAARFSGPGQPYEGLAKMTSGGPRWTGEVRMVDEHLRDPLRWQKPRRVFVNSMSDLFHPGLSDEQIRRVFTVMALAPRHQFQVLTKRPERMARFLLDADLQDELQATYESAPATLPEWKWPVPWIWLGTSLEDQPSADERVPHLLRCPAAVRFVSAEPLLGPVDLSRFHIGWSECPRCGTVHDPSTEFPLGAERFCGGDMDRDIDCWYEGPLRIAGHHLHWLIAGGESGPGARPMHPEWARSLRNQCQAAGVAFFFKQWGEWAPGAGWDEDTLLRTESAYLWRVGEPGGEHVYRVGKRRAGRMLDGREWSEFPEVRA